MKKPFEVKEYDNIICDKYYTNDERYKPVSEENFENIRNFIQEFNGLEENTDILEFMRIGYKRDVKNVISIRNYVGIVQMKNGFQLQILPKISFSNEENEIENDKKTKQIFIKMLRTMKDFPVKVFNEASLNVDNMNLYEIFINMFIKEVHNLLKHGIKSAYEEQEDNLNYFKGKLLLNNQINKNIVHKEKFYCSFDEFNQNRAENKLIKSTLLKLQNITNSSENSKSIKQLLVAFEMIDTSKNYEQDFSKINLSREMKDYETLMKWSKIFLMNKSFSTFSGDTISTALLFPMEKIFESYVARKMKEVMMEDGWEVSVQDEGHYLFTEPKKQFAIRPDIVMRKGERTIILDTKWKKLIDNENKNYGISQGDMYQMYAYSKKYNTPEIWMLYPINKEMRNHEPIKFKSYFQEKQNEENKIIETTVNIHFVDLERINENLEELKRRI